MSFVVDIEVEPPDTDAIYALLEDRISQGFKELANEIEETWRAHASDKLKTTKQRYQDALTVVPTTDKEVVAKLEGALPVGVEMGSQPFDMKNTHLGNKKSRAIPIGKYPGGPTGNYSFRTMSVNSPGWRHPGIKAVNIAVAVTEDLEKDILFKVFDPLLRSRISI